MRLGNMCLYEVWFAKFELSRRLPGENLRKLHLHIYFQRCSDHRRSNWLRSTSSCRAKSLAANRRRGLSHDDWRRLSAMIDDITGAAKEIDYEAVRGAHLALAELWRKARP